MSWAGCSLCARRATASGADRIFSGQYGTVTYQPVRMCEVASTASTSRRKRTEEHAAPDFGAGVT
jgi:hypothetical protein